MDRSTSTFLPSSLASMSIWMMVAFLAKVLGFRATRSEKRVPTAMRTSQSATARFEV